MSDVIDIKQNKRNQQIKDTLAATLANMVSLEMELEAIEHKLLARVVTIKDDINLYREQVVNWITLLYQEYPDLQPDEFEEDIEE